MTEDLTAPRWADLAPDPRFVQCLDAADAQGARSRVLESTDGSPKGQWSKRLADASARMVADELRRHKSLKKMTVLPSVDGKNEQPTFTAGGKEKKVDVTVSSVVSGLQIGFSLKGMNFRDREHKNFDKNLTGRTYELQDELRLLHGYQPSAFIAALYFMPVGSTSDKSTSSFAHTVAHLRGFTGRLDISSPQQLAQADAAIVALYSPGDDESFTEKKSGDVFTYRDTLPRGVIRYFDVMSDPPRHGRPILTTTMSLEEMVTNVISRAHGEESTINYAPPETDAP